MASDHRGWLGLTLVSCLLATCLSSSFPSAKPVNDGSSLFLTKRAERLSCCPLSGLPWDARVENGTVPRPKKMAFMLGAQKAGEEVDIVCSGFTKISLLSLSKAQVICSISL